MVGEYARAFYGSQATHLAPLLKQHGVQLWLPETDSPEAQPSVDGFAPGVASRRLIYPPLRFRSCPPRNRDRTDGFGHSARRVPSRAAFTAAASISAANASTAAGAR